MAEQLVDPLVDMIEMTLALYGVSATKFGYSVAGDAGLLKKMKSGRRVRPRMREKIEAGLRRIEMGREL